MSEVIVNDNGDVAGNEADDKATTTTANEQPSISRAEFDKLQAQFAAMAASQGVPTDPREAATNDLKAHVRARQDANPNVDLSRLSEAVDGYADGKVSVDEVRDEIDAAIDSAASRGPDYAYLRELGRNLSKADRESK